jgi:hypothetical protein
MSSAMRVMPVNRRQIYYAVLISTRPAHAHDKGARLIRISPVLFF